MKELMSVIIKECLDRGKLQDIYRLYLDYGVELVCETLVRLGILQENIEAYFCLAYLAQKSETAKDKAIFHNCAGNVLVTGLAYMEGAYALAYFHTIQAMESQPEDINYKQYFLRLFTKDLPDFEVETGMRIQVAQDILRIDHSNLLAREVLRTETHGKDRGRQGDGSSVWPESR